MSTVNIRAAWSRCESMLRSFGVEVGNEMALTRGATKALRR